MDELDIKGKRYISSKRASQLTGYAKDYIGQLAREGKIIGTRMGRAWYIDEDSLMHHARTDFSGVSFAERIQPSAVSQVTSGSLALSNSYRLPETWSQIRYMEDDRDLFPPIMSGAEQNYADLHEGQNVLINIRKKSDEIDAVKNIAQNIVTTVERPAEIEDNKSLVPLKPVIHHSSNTTNVTSIPSVHRAVSRGMNFDGLFVKPASNNRAKVQQGEQNTKLSGTSRAGISSRKGVSNYIAAILVTLSVLLLIITALGPFIGLRSTYQNDLESSSMAFTASVIHATTILRAIDN